MRGRIDFPTTSRPWRLALHAALALLLVACGGGGSGGAAGASAPPAGLAYATALAVYETQAEITPNVPASTGGAITSYSVTPALPLGLALDPVTGLISGTPVVITPPGDHVVTATNAAGATDATVRVEVVPGSESLVPMPTASMTDADLRHFLGRTWYGGTEVDVLRCRSQGVPAFVDEMIEFTTDPALEAAADALLQHDTDPPGLVGRFPTWFDLVRRSVYLLLHNANPFQEILGQFWHDHFATSDINLDPSSFYWMKTHMDLWRLRGNGNLRSLLVDMARDWVMLDWLNGLDSTKVDPNQNFAREFWELFTLGVDNGYTEADIRTAARAWTGYRRRYDVVSGAALTLVEFDAARHDPEAKTIFGRTIAAQDAHDDFAEVVDITLAERPVAEFICRRLFEHFCYPGPSEAVVGTLAQTLRASGYDLKPALRQLLTSEAFFSARSRAGQVKSPVEYALGLIRSTGLHVPLDTLAYLLYVNGQIPTFPPSVGGWPENLGWLSAQAMFDRANIALDVIQERPYQASLGIDPAALLPAGRPDSGQVVDALATLLHVTLTPAARTIAQTYLDTQPQADGTTLPDPFDVDTDVDERVRGLIYILAQHPTYQVR